MGATLHRRQLFDHHGECGLHGLFVNAMGLLHVLCVGRCGHGMAVHMMGRS